MSQAVNGTRSDADRLPASSAAQCAAACLQQDGCISFNYNHADARPCELGYFSQTYAVVAKDASKHGGWGLGRSNARVVPAYANCAL